MEKLTFYNINKILENLADRRSSDFEFDQFLNNEVNSLNDLYENNRSEDMISEIEKLGQFKLVQDNESELEGYGEIPVKKIFHFIDHDIYVQFKGFWSSNGGSQFESCKEVKPVTKTITVYE